jgi:hypothetical protein
VTLKDVNMSTENSTGTTASGPDPSAWIVALGRAFHPLRWGLCFVGLVLTGVIAAVVQSVFTLKTPDVVVWYSQPVEQAQALQETICGGSLGRMLVRGGTLLGLVAALWCLIGGWIARHELLARRPTSYDSDETPPLIGPTTLVIRWGKSLLTCCSVVLFLILFLIVPVGLAGLINGGIGSVLVALVLPLVLLADLLLFFIALAIATGRHRC